MSFELARAGQVLERTPAVLHALLDGLDPSWSQSNEGPAVGPWREYLPVPGLASARR